MPASARSFESGAVGGHHQPRAQATSAAIGRCRRAATSRRPRPVPVPTTCSGHMHLHARAPATPPTGGRPASACSTIQPSSRRAERIGIEHQLAAAGRIPHPHRAVGLHARLAHAAPYAEVVEQRRVVGRERVHAQVDVGRVRCRGVPARRFARLDQRHLQAVARERQRRGRTDHAGTDHDHVEQFAPAHARPHRAACGTAPARRRGNPSHRPPASTAPRAAGPTRTGPGCAAAAAGSTDWRPTAPTGRKTPRCARDRRDGAARTRQATPASPQSAAGIGGARVPRSVRPGSAHRASPRLKPCAPIGWIVCAALPISTARVAVVRRASTRNGGVLAARAAAEEAPGAPAERRLRARQERRLVERGHRVGIAAGHGMDQAVVAVAARQQRGRAVVAESFVSGAIGRALACAGG